MKIKRSSVGPNEIPAAVAPPAPLLNANEPELLAAAVIRIVEPKPEVSCRCNLADAVSLPIATKSEVVDVCITLPASFHPPPIDCSPALFLK